MADFTKRLNSWAGLTGKKGPGFCAICGAYGDLTRDHVPPKACVQITNAVLSRLIVNSGDRSTSNSSMRIQGGLKFKTLCGNCNNNLLGLKYDPELKYFVDGVQTSFQNADRYVVLPRLIKTEANLHSVARSVIGHLLAAHSVPETQKRIINVGATEVLRQYFLNSDAPFPADWRLYCWPYFSRTQIILRHAAWMDVSVQNINNKVTYGHLLKFLPLAFWLVYEQPHNFIIPENEITPKGNTSNKRDTIDFDLQKAPHLSYPEVPTGHRILLFADEQSSSSKPTIQLKARKNI